MAESGALERGRVRARLIRDLARGEHKQTELAKRYGVTQPAISMFASRHAEEIADVAGRIEDQFAALWAADKFNRVAELQQQAEDIAAIMADPVAAARAGVGAAEMYRVFQQALRGISEELGQLPARVQVQHSGSLSVELNGVNVEALR